MAAPKDAPEDAFRLRRFLGTNTQLDPAFLGPQILARSQNWIPAQSRRIGKRPGTKLLQHTGLGVSSISSLVACQSATDVPYLFAYGIVSGGGALVVQSQGEGPFTVTPGAIFASNRLGRLIRFRNRIYAGNGIDPIKSWIIGSTDGTAIETYAALTTTDPTGTVFSTDNPAATTTLMAAMPTGNYQCCFALFDTGTGLYVSRTPPFLDHSPGATVMSGINIGQGAHQTGQFLTVKAPDAALGPNQVYRFFIAYRGFPIEYATAQGPDWAKSEVRTFTSIDVTDTRCPINTGVMRTGNMFLVWRNRVVFAGDGRPGGEPHAIYATDVILPGLEQTVFNQGTFFPVDAKVPLPDTVTGIGIAGVTTDQDAQSPLLFFTRSRTFLATGDPFDSNDETAQLIELSSRVGCVAHDTIVNTPFGTLFVGIDSIYMIPTGGGYPQDVGWPIADQILAVGAQAGASMVATYHKGFYKVSIPPAGGGPPINAWWLDLRQGVGDVPSWWGPQVVADFNSTASPQGPLSFSALTSDPASVLESDRGYGAVTGTDEVVALHQLGIYSDMGAAIRSILVTGRFDADQPFIPKIITRLRVITQSTGPGSIKVFIQTDGGVSWDLVDDIDLGNEQDAGQWVHNIPPVGFPEPPLPIRNQWSTVVPNIIHRATWRSTTPFEAQSIMPAERPRGLSIQITLTHEMLTSIEMRDFEILFLWSARKVRYYSERVSK